MKNKKCPYCKNTFNIQGKHYSVIIRKILSVHECVKVTLVCPKCKINIEFALIGINDFILD